MVKGDFTGRFLQPGVAEFTMACIMNGMALHGGVIPACGTFFVFSDYMKPALRIAALQRLPVKYVWTHDSFPRGRGRSDAPTDRTRSTVAPDGTTAQPQRRTFGRRTPSGRQLRNRRRLENRDGKRTSDRADPVASEYQESARSERRPRQGSHAGRQGRLYRRRLRRNPGRNLAGERFGSGYADRRRRKAESRRRESTRSIGSVRRTIPRPEQGSTRRACCRAACRSSV